MLTCPYCHDWEAHPQDRFCGGCGRSYIEVKATIVNALQFEWNRVQAVTVELCNTGRIATGGGIIQAVTEGGTVLWTATVPPDKLSAQGDVWQGSWQPGQGTAPTVAELRFCPNDAGQDIVVGILGFGLRRALAALVSETVVLDIAKVSPDEDVSIQIGLRLVQGHAGQLNQVVLVDAQQNETDIDLGNLILRPNKPVEFALPLSARIRQQLRSNPSGVKVTLRVRFQGHEEQRLPLCLTVSMPARVDVTVSTRWWVQVNRPAFVPIKLANNGGTPVRVTSLALSWTAKSELPNVKASFPKRGVELKGGESHHLILEIPVLASEPTTISALIVITLSGGQTPRPVNVQINIRAPQTYDGTVAIDFGTTETAVAVRRRGVNEAPGILNMEGESEFVPTVVAYQVDNSGSLQTLVGRRARAVAEANSNATMVIEGLKWRVADDLEFVRPDGSVCFMLEVVADYLRQLKTRIEEHVDIGANIVTALVTVPSRFNPAQSAALLEAFRLAGIKPRRVSVGGKPTLVAESWSPAGLVLPLPALSTISRQAIPASVPIAQASEGTFGLVTFDMGGGSTDVSAFHIEIENRATITVTEIFVDGTNDVAGNVVSQLLAEAIMPSLRVALLNRRIPEQDVPIEPPWAIATAGESDPIAGENGRSLARVIWALQASAALGAARDLSRLTEAELLETVKIFETQIISNARLLDLVLRDRSGKQHWFSWDEAGLRLDIEGFLRNFITGPGSAAVRLVQAAVDALKMTGEQWSNHILMTGRGSIFSLTGLMIQHLLADMWEGDSIQIRMQEDFLKPVTSVGALVLADVLPQAQGIRFASGLSAWFGFRGRPDPATGQQEFIALCEGLPTKLVVEQLPAEWPDEYTLVLGTSMSRNGAFAQTSFRDDFEIAVHITQAGQQAPRYLRVTPAGEHEIDVEIVSATDPAAALQTTEVLFKQRLGLLPAGYLLRKELAGDGERVS